MTIETVNSTNLLHKNTNTVAKNDTRSSVIKTDFVKTPEKDKFEKIYIKNKNTEPKKI